MSDKKETIFYSNSFEDLLTKLFESLLVSKDPFQKNFIFIPSYMLKHWVQKQLASRHKVISAFFCKDLKEIDEIFSYGSQNSFISFFELNLLLEQEIISFIIEDKDSFKIVTNYLEINSNDIDYLKFSAKTKHRLQLLCEELALLFILYGTYGKKILEEKDSSHWQIKLFQRILEKSKSKILIKDFAKPFIKNAQFHFFGWNYIPQVFHEYFNLVSLHCPIYHYVFSPCKFYWEDVCSKFEQKSLSKFYKKKQVVITVQDELEEYLKDTNSLLANLGKLGREYLKLVEDKDLFIEDFYEEKKQDNCLSVLKEDVLFLVNPEKEKSVCFNESDDSLVINVASSKLREVQILFNELLKIALIDPKVEVTVFAPNIEDYFSYIQMVFGNQENFNFSVLDLEIFSKSDFAKGYLSLLSFFRGFWEKDSFISLLNNPTFYQKAGFTKEDITVIESWIDKSNLKWGLNSSQRQEQSNSSLNDCYINSWDHALERMLYSLFYVNPEESSLSKREIDGLDLSSVEIFNKFLTLFQKLKKDWMDFFGIEQFSLKQWEKKLLSFYEQYFFINGENAKEVFASSLFHQYVKQLNSLEEKLNEIKPSFLLIYSSLKTAFQSKKFSFQPQISNGITFCSLKEGSMIPSNNIFIIGLQDNFPSSRKFNSLNLIAKFQKNSFYPISNDEQKYLFLQAISLAKNQLCLSYVEDTQSSQDIPSILIDELISYVDKRFYTKQKQKASSFIVRKHPYFPFNQKYFSNNTNYNSLVQEDGVLAKSFYEEKKESPFIFFSPQSNDLKEYKSDVDSIELNLKDLSSFATHPLRFYFNKILEVYFFTEKKNQIEELTLSFLEKYVLQKDLRKQDRDNYLNKVEQTGFFPPGILGEVAKDNIKNQMQDFEDLLNHLQVSKEEIYKLKLKSNLEKIVKPEKYDIEVPCIKLNLNKTIIKIVGEIDCVTSKGLIVFSNDKFPSLIKNWPILLVYLLLSEEYDFSSDILFVKGNKRINFELSIEEELKRFLRYYLYAQENPSFLMPFWAKEFLTKDKNSFKDSIRNFIRNYSDRYVAVSLASIEDKHFDFIYEKWFSFLQKTFCSLIQREL